MKPYSERVGIGKRGPAKRPAGPLSDPYIRPASGTAEIDAALDLLAAVQSALTDIGAGYVGRVATALDLLAAGLPEVRAARESLAARESDRYRDPAALLAPGEACAILGISPRGLQSMRNSGRITGTKTPGWDGTTKSGGRYYYTVAEVEAAAAKRAENAAHKRRLQSEFLARVVAERAARIAARAEKKLPRTLDKP